MSAALIRHKPNESLKLKDFLQKNIKIVKKNIIIKDHLDKNNYCSNIINDIIFNEKAHVVALFKDFLIFDDVSEFLKRLYKTHESLIRLPKICEFYESYSKIFPNYTNIPESKYMYKNIKRKQKVIDNNQKLPDDYNEDDEEDKIINTQALNSIMNQTETVNNSRRVDETIQSFEGLIESIGRAENTKDVRIDLNNKIIIPITNSSTNNQIIYNFKEQKECNQQNSNKNAYNFKLNLDLLKNNNNEEIKIASKNENLNNKIIINKIDELQKLKIKVNAGLINSARSKNEKQIRELYQEFYTKKVHVSPKETSNVIITNPNTHNNFKSNINFKRSNFLVKDLNTINYDETKNVPLKEVLLSERNSKIFEVVEINKTDSKNIYKRENINKPFQKKVKNNIVIEENIENPKTKTKFEEKVALKSTLEKKIHHKTTTSMSKIIPNKIYNNYHIVNNIHNIILKNNINEKQIENNSKFPISSRLDLKVTENSCQLKNKSRTDIKPNTNDFIKQNVKKLMNELNQKSKEKINYSNPLMKRTISNENSKSNLKGEKAPLSSAIERDLLTITSSKCNKDTIDREMQSERTISSKKLINSIIKSDSIVNKILSSRTTLDKSSDKVIKFNSKVRTTSTINIERKSSMLSTNNSNLLQNKKPIKDLKSIFKDKSKNTISPRNINNKINNNIYEKIRKNSSSKIENSTSNNNCNNKIYFNHFESHNPKSNDTLNNNFNTITTKTIKKNLDLKPRNFYDFQGTASIQFNNADLSNQTNQIKEMVKIPYNKNS